MEIWHPDTPGKSSSLCALQKILLLSQLTLLLQDDFDFDILDATKIWPEEDVPIRYIGELELNRNVDEYFTQVEQVHTREKASAARALTASDLRSPFAHRISSLVLTSRTIPCSKVATSRTLTHNSRDLALTGIHIVLIKECEKC